MAIRISLCLMVWNELEGCKKDVPRLPLDDFEEVYAIDLAHRQHTRLPK
jgi:hypothetical protein